MAPGSPNDSGSETDADMPCTVIGKTLWSALPTETPRWNRGFDLWQKGKWMDFRMMDELVTASVLGTYDSRQLPPTSGYAKEGSP